MMMLTSCLRDKCTSTRTYIQYTPVYKTMDEIREMVKMDAPQTLKKPGKIWIRNNHLFINEYGLGIHIYDYSNKSNPTPVSFLQIPGNVDMAVKNNTLYVDQFTDLVAFDISDLSNIVEVSRVEGTFPENVSVHEKASRWLVNQEQGIAIDWIEEEVEVDCDGYGDDAFFAQRAVMEDASSVGSPNSSGNSQGGSMARFSIIGDYLYTVDTRTMRLYDLQNNSVPTYTKEVDLPWGIETIFPFYRDDKSYLFLGSNSGMYIYDNSIPFDPVQIGAMEHVTSCDPVVAQDNHAYVTLRSGNTCEGWTDQLEIADITDLENPERVRIHDMTNPHGLGVDGGLLFICDGRDGLKIYDISDDPSAKKLKKIEHFKNFTAYDVIPSNGTLILSATNGFYLFDYSNPKDIKQVGHISANVGS